MRFLTFSFSFLLSSTFAYQVTEPSSRKGWSNSGGQTLSWNRVVTDPDTFTVLLTNQDPSIMPQGDQVLAAQVDGDLQTITLQPPSGGWPTGGSFRVNLVKNTEELQTILAQSNEFDIKFETESPALSSTQVSTPSSSTGSITLTPVSTRVSTTILQSATSGTPLSASIAPSSTTASVDSPGQTSASLKKFEFHFILVPLLAAISFALA